MAGRLAPLLTGYVHRNNHNKRKRPAKLANTGTIGNVFQMDSSRLMERWWFA